MDELDVLRDLIGSETEVFILFVEKGISLSAKLFVGSDSRLKPVHRLCVHDSKGNTLLLRLDKGAMDVRSVGDDSG